MPFFFLQRLDYIYFLALSITCWATHFNPMLGNTGTCGANENIESHDRSLVETLSGQPSVPILVEVIGGNDQDDDIVNWINERKN